MLAKYHKIFFNKSPISAEPIQNLWKNTTAKYGLKVKRVKEVNFILR